jgi:hypothetical protein
MKEFQLAAERKYIFSNQVNFGRRRLDGAEMDMSHAPVEDLCEAESRRGQSGAETASDQEDV